MTSFKQLCALSDGINTLTGRNFRVKGQNSVVCLYDEQGACYSPWLTNKVLGQWLDALRRGFEIARQRIARKPLAALKVIALDPKIRAFLMEKDPKALEQVEAAIAEIETPA